MEQSRAVESVVEEGPARPPTLLLLHGVSPTGAYEGWHDAIEEGLRAAGFPGLDDVTVIAPSYADLLLGDGPLEDAPSLPSRTDFKLGATEWGRFRRLRERRTHEFERLLGHHQRGRLQPRFDTTAHLANIWFPQVRAYLGEPTRRAATVARVLEHIPSEGDLVVVAHSLGSAVALDVLARLPRGVRVHGLLTIGSPAGRRDLHVGSDRFDLAERRVPVEVWVNVWNPADVICGRRGVSRIFGWALDVPVDLGVRHSAATYLTSPPAREALGRMLHGSPGSELVLAGSSPDVVPTDAERALLLSMLTAHLIGDRLSGDKQERWRDALAIVQRDAAHQAVAPYAASGRHAPLVLQRLEAGERPDPSPDLSVDAAIDLLVALGTANLVAPYEIRVEGAVVRGALQDLTAALELGTSVGIDVYESLREAAAALTTKKSSATRWLLAGGGVAILALGPIGLAVAAPAGLAGGAAVVGALAAFGPGGMVGGLATVMALTGAGAGTTSAALARADATPEAVEGVVLQTLSAALVRHRQGIEQDPGTVSGLLELEMALSRKVAHLERFSDGRAPSVRETRTKLATASLALRHLRKQGLVPIQPLLEEPEQPTST
ncbi:hypothetical protein KLP28_15515 [Nocardioidaceae bacterium]|nr:hypothetical protein KLP28_15515 [Nocardioidaceae bacterium]